MVQSAVTGFEEYAANSSLIRLLLENDEMTERLVRGVIDFRSGRVYAGGRNSSRSLLGDCE